MKHFILFLLILSLAACGPSANQAAEPTITPTPKILASVEETQNYISEKEDDSFEMDGYFWALWESGFHNYTTTFPDIDSSSQPGDILVYEISLSESTPVLWVHEECAPTQEDLDELLSNITIEFFINDELIPLSQFAVIDVDFIDGSPCRSYAALVNNWAREEYIFETHATYKKSFENIGTGKLAGTYIWKYLVKVHSDEEMAQAQTQAAAPIIVPTMPPTSTPTPTPAITPVSTSSSASTSESWEVYESKLLGISIRYPTGWDVSEEDFDNTVITVGQEDKFIYMIFFPAGAQRQHDYNPATALVSFIEFAGYILPDKEKVHIVRLDDSEYAFGSYNNPEVSPGLFYKPNPMFMAMRFTQEHTIVIESRAHASKEEETREALELILASLPPSPQRTVVAIPTLEPNVSRNLPTAPAGFHWQGVANIDLAIPVPDGWFVEFIPRTETWQGSLQEYDYLYIITQENPDYTGVNSPVLGSMRVTAIKDNSMNVNNAARDMHQEFITNPNTTKVIEEQVSEQGKNIIYKFHAEGTNSGVAPGDPGHNQTMFRIAIANTEAKTLYVLVFMSATEVWEQEWETGQVMMELMLELLEQ
jgi:hypothetical protein